MRKRPSVTQLVDFAKCEKLAILKLDRREELDAVRSGAVKRGESAHRRMERAATVDGRCFVASFAYGPNAKQTQLLRAFRDALLLPSLPGRALVHTYYLISPLAVALLRRAPWGRRVARLVVDFAIVALAKLRDCGKGQ